MPDQELLNDFLEALERAGSPVRNPVRREALEWPEAQFEEVKAELAARRIVVRGRGHSDTVSLVGAEPVQHLPTPSRNGKRAKSPGTGAAKEAAKDESLETWIWDAACSIRGAKDAAKYKDYILPTAFRYPTSGAAFPAA